MNFSVALKGISHFNFFFFIEVPPVTILCMFIICNIVLPYIGNRIWKLRPFHMKITKLDYWMAGAQQMLKFCSRIHRKQGFSLHKTAKVNQDQGENCTCLKVFCSWLCDWAHSQTLTRHCALPPPLKSPTSHFLNPIPSQIQTYTHTQHQCKC